MNRRLPLVPLTPSETLRVAEQSLSRRLSGESGDRAGWALVWLLAALSCGVIGAAAGQAESMEEKR